MNRKILLLSLLAIIILASIGFTKQVRASPTYSLKEAVEQGVVSAKICGTWTFSGYSLNLTLMSQVDYALTITITIGRILIPQKEEYQSMVIGDYYVIELNAREVKRMLLFGFCIESGDDAPDETVCFRLDGVNQGLVPVLEVIKGRDIPEIAPRSFEDFVRDATKGFEGYQKVFAAQLAIWAVLDPENPPWEGTEAITILQNQTWMNQSWVVQQMELAREMYEEATTFSQSPTPTSIPSKTPPQTPSETNEPPPSNKSLVFTVCLIALVVVLAATIGLIMIKGGRIRAREAEKPDDKMDKLEKALLEGRISEETYEELKKKYKRENKG